MASGRLDTLDPHAVLSMLLALGRRPRVVVFERLTCPPWMPRRTVGSLFQSTGHVRGVCAAFGLPVALIAAAKWQRALFGAPPKRKRKKDEHGRETGSKRKKLFVLRARERWPQFDFPFASGAADAAWLAVYGERFL